MPWKNKFKDLTPIINKIDQEYKGDYTGEIYNQFWDCNTIENIEEKYINSDNCLFIETWSCRTGRNKGWIYKQLETEYLFFSNNEACYSINYPKLRELWFKLYPDPRKRDDYKIMNYIANKFINDEFKWSYTKTQQLNQSEGYYIPIEWFYMNDLIIEKWNKK